MKIKQLFFAVLSTVIFLFIVAIPVKAQNVNPVVWKTNYAKLSASNFHIRIGKNYYYGADQVTVSSDPGSERSTLELTWNENLRPMRMNLYFQKTTLGEWELYDLRTYDGSSDGDWIYYSPKDSLGNSISSLTGMHNYASERIFLPKSGEDADIFCQECAITAFLDIPLEFSSYGYALEVLNGLETNKTITLSTNPMSGYGVNVLLKDRNKQVVTNQSGMTYKWQVRNTAVAEVSTMNLEYSDGKCAYGIEKPCPNVNGQIRGKSPGVTTIDVSVIKNGTVIASNEFDVKVVAYVPQSSTPTPSGTPRPSTTPTPLTSPGPSVKPTPSPSVTPTPVPTNEPDYEKFQEELEVLKGAVGEIKIEAKQQRQELSSLQRLMESIVSFFNRWTWFR